MLYVDSIVEKTNYFLKDTLGSQPIAGKDKYLLETSYKKLLEYQSRLIEKMQSTYAQPQGQETIHLSKEEVKLLLLNHPSYRIINSSTGTPVLHYLYVPYASLEEVQIMNLLVRVASYESDQLREEELKKLSNFFGNGSIRNIVFQNMPKGLEIPIRAIPLILNLTRKQITVSKNNSLYEELGAIYHFLPEKETDKKLSLNYQEDE